MALGVDAWRRFILGRFAWMHWLTALAFLPLALLDVYLLWRFIVRCCRREGDQRSAFSRQEIL
jgi:membrane protein implicated in regulation of membrane protease activity